MPLFTAFIIGMFWKRASAGSGFWGILVGTVATIAMYILYRTGVLDVFRSGLHYSLWSGIVGLVAGGLALLIASWGQAPKPDEELHGLVQDSTQQVERTTTWLTTRLKAASPQILLVGP